MTVQQDSFLPMATLEEQLSTVELYLAMYSAGDELIITEEDMVAIGLLREYLTGKLTSHSRTMPSQIRFVLRVSQGTRSIDLNVTIPLTRQEKGGRWPVLSLVRPPYLQRRDYELLARGLPCGSEDSISTAMDYLQSSDWIRSALELDDTTEPVHVKSLNRVWLYFPSLSTREKREDLVLLAPSYHLTGFVLAGKPGVLCLEGRADDVQAYLADIKRNSWADIPSHQKKITERFREVENVSRKFVDMKEITADIARHGQRGNRGDLGQVEQFLDDVDLGYAFEAVFNLK